MVCDDLGITEYALFQVPKKDLKIKDRADLLEAFLGALYVDKDLEYCQVFAAVCFFPRLQQFIVNQEWNDPKSKLQQCCLTLRTMDGGEPDIPVYKVNNTLCLRWIREVRKIAGQKFCCFCILLGILKLKKYLKIFSTGTT